MVDCRNVIDGRIQVGNRIRSTGTFTNAADDYNPFDPNGAIQVTIKDPLGTTMTYEYGVGSEIERDGIGVYYVEFTLTEPGTWYVKWRAVHDAEECCVSEVGFRVLSTVI